MTDELSFEYRVDIILNRMNEIIGEFKSIANELKILKKEHIKTVKKIVGRKTPKDLENKREPSGFCKPRQISAELAMFLNVDNNTSLSSPELTKLITNYIRINKLQLEEDNRIIDLNKPGGEKLRKLLKIPENQELSFFNLQHYTKTHFVGDADEPKKPDVSQTESNITVKKMRKIKKFNE